MIYDNAKPRLLNCMPCVLKLTLAPTFLACLRAHVPTGLTCFHAHISTCLSCLRAYVLTCQCTLSAYLLYVSNCFACLCTHVLTCLASSRAQVPTWLKSFASHGFRERVVTCQHASRPQ